MLYICLLLSPLHLSQLLILSSFASFTNVSPFVNGFNFYLKITMILFYTWNSYKTTIRQIQCLLERHKISIQSQWNDCSFLWLCNDNKSQEQTWTTGVNCPSCFSQTSVHHKLQWQCTPDTQYCIQVLQQSIFCQTFTWAKPLAKANFLI